MSMTMRDGQMRPGYVEMAGQKAEVEGELARCRAENERLREGIRRALDILNQVHLYDSPEYEELEALLSSEQEASDG